jgi:hypothetical protein
MIARRDSQLFKHQDRVKLVEFPLRYFPQVNRACFQRSLGLSAIENSFGLVVLE